MKENIFIALLLFGFINFFSCYKNDNDKEKLEEFTGFSIPYNFPSTTYNFEANQITKEGFELGKKLFYDPILSLDNSISCGNCHIQSSSFTQHGHSVSHGIFDRQGKRNSPPIMNLAWSKSFMWDGGVFDLDLQPILPITSEDEMGETLNQVLQKLKNKSEYLRSFQKAFPGSSEITGALLFKALSQFMLMCVSSNSKYDSVIRNQSAFSYMEEEGYNLFKKKCNNCHSEPLFTDQSFRNNGLSISEMDDKGLYNITLQKEDLYKFKVPSLRNLLYTKPYMHDGRFLNLDAVFDHYTKEIQNSPTLDNALKQSSIIGISITKDEKEKLISFLNTLNDKFFVSDKKLSE